MTEVREEHGFDETSLVNKIRSASGEAGLKAEIGTEEETRERDRGVRWEKPVLRGKTDSTGGPCVPALSTKKNPRRKSSWGS